MFRCWIVVEISFHEIYPSVVNLAKLISIWENRLPARPWKIQHLNLYPAAKLDVGEPADIGLDELFHPFVISLLQISQGGNLTCQNWLFFLPSWCISFYITFYYMQVSQNRKMQAERDRICHWIRLKGKVCQWFQFWTSWKTKNCLQLLVKRVLVVLAAEVEMLGMSESPWLVLPFLCRLCGSFLQSNNKLLQIIEPLEKLVDSPDQCATPTSCSNQPTVVLIIGSITSRCVGKEPTLLPRTHDWMHEDSFVSLSQWVNRPQIFVRHKI